LPAIFEWPLQVQEGGLMSYGANDVETYQHVATYIDRLFQGARPATFPYGSRANCTWSSISTRRRRSPHDPTIAPGTGTPGGRVTRPWGDGHEHIEVR
jgi:hypothetical protein